MDEYPLLNDRIYTSLTSPLDAARKSLLAANREAVAAIDIIVQMGVDELPIIEPDEEKSRYKKIFEWRKLRAQLQRNYTI